MPPIAWFHLYEMSIKGKLIEAESRVWGGGKMESDCWWALCFFLRWWKYCGISGNGYTHLVNILKKTTELYISFILFKRVNFRVHKLYLKKQNKKLRATEDKMVGRHHHFSGHELGQIRGDGEGQGSLVCCSPWGLYESDTTWRLNNHNDRKDQIQTPCSPSSRLAFFKVRGTLTIWALLMGLLTLTSAFGLVWLQRWVIRMRLDSGLGPECEFRPHHSLAVDSESQVPYLRTGGEDGGPFSAGGWWDSWYEKQGTVHLALTMGCLHLFFAFSSFFLLLLLLPLITVVVATVPINPQIFYFFFLTLPSPFPSCFSVHLSGPGGVLDSSHLLARLLSNSLCSQSPRLVHLLPQALR